MTTITQPPADSDSPPAPPVRPADHHPLRQPVRIGGMVLAAVFVGLVGLNVVDQTAGKVHAVDQRVFDDRVTAIRLSSSSGDVRVAGSTGDQLVVEAWTTGTVVKPELDVEISADGATVSMHAACPVPFWNCDASFEVTLPAGVSLDARTSSGDVEATDVVGPATLRTGSGDVRVLGASGDRLVLDTSSGDVEAEDVSVADLSASTSSGDVTASFDVAPRQVEAVTSSGDVAVAVPDAPDDRGDNVYYDVDATTSSGDRIVEVRTDPTADRRIEARTSSGDVTVRYAVTP